MLVNTLHITNFFQNLITGQRNQRQQQIEYFPHQVATWATILTITGGVLAVESLEGKRGTAGWWAGQLLPGQPDECAVILLCTNDFLAEGQNEQFSRVLRWTASHVVHLRFIEKPSILVGCLAKKKRTNIDWVPFRKCRINCLDSTKGQRRGSASSESGTEQRKTAPDDLVLHGRLEFAGQDDVSDADGRRIIGTRLHCRHL